MVPKSPKQRGLTVSPALINETSIDVERELKRMLSLGNELKKLRLTKQMTARSLAAAVGITERHVFKIEAGTCLPTFPVVKGIAEALGCSLDYLAKFI